MSFLKHKKKYSWQIEGFLWKIAMKFMIYDFGVFIKTVEVSWLSKKIYMTFKKEIFHQRW